MNKMDHDKLLRFIYEVSFAIDDCVLFLDTHPYDEGALEYYENYKKLRMQAVKEYTQCFGPLTNDNVTVRNYWTWINEPWPWEGAC